MVLGQPGKEWGRKSWAGVERRGAGPAGWMWTAGKRDGLRVGLWFWVLGWVFLFYFCFLSLFLFPIQTQLKLYLFEFKFKI